MPPDPHHLDCLQAALELALDAPRDQTGTLTPEGKAQVQAALDQAGAPAKHAEGDSPQEPDPLRDAILKGALPTWSPDGSGWVVGDQLDLDEDEGPPLSGDGTQDHAEHVSFGSWTGFRTRTGKQGWKNEVTGERRYQPNAPEEKGETHYQQQHQQRRQRAEARLNAPAAVGHVSTVAHDGLMEHFAGQISAQDLPALVGALPGSTVSASAWTAGGKIHLEVEGPRYIECSRTIIPQPDGRLIVHNDMFFLRRKYKGGGQGAKQFRDQVQRCAELGVDEIETLAGKGTLHGAAMTGYQAWPALGYDASLEDARKAGMPPLPPEFAGAKTLQDLFAMPGGEDWWSGPRGEDGRRKPGGGHGVMMTMHFDLTPGSPSLRRLNAYLAKKGMPTVEVSTEGGTPQERRKAATAASRQKRQEQQQQQQAAADQQRREAEEARRQRWEDAHEEFGKAAGQAGFHPGQVRNGAERRFHAMMDQRQAGTAYTLSQPLDMLRSAYYDEINDLTTQRHLARLASPAARPIARAWIERAARLGISSQELDQEARNTPVSIPDAETAIRRSYARALGTLARRRAAQPETEAGGQV